MNHFLTYDKLKDHLGKSINKYKAKIGKRIYTLKYLNSKDGKNKLFEYFKKNSFCPFLEICHEKYIHNNIDTLDDYIDTRKDILFYIDYSDEYDEWLH